MMVGRVCSTVDSGIESRGMTWGRSHAATERASGLGGGKKLFLPGLRVLLRRLGCRERSEYVRASEFPYTGQVRSDISAV